MIVEKAISLQELKQIAAGGFGNMVKAVVDLERRVMAVDGHLHSDLEAALLEDGSQSRHLWGINFYPDVPGEGFVEFDSMINLRPAQGNTSRGVDSGSTQAAIRALVGTLVTR